MMNKTIKRNERGFTLLELLLVLAIIAVLVFVSIPLFSGYTDKAKGATCVANARQAYMASNLGLLDWKSKGSPGNGDKAYKINIENEIVKQLDLGTMQSFTATNSYENTVQVALSLPSYYSQGWDTFINDCNNNNAKNFVRVWIGKNSNKKVKDTVAAVYYVSPDGKFASRIVYDSATKLGSAEQKTGAYYERIA